MKKLHPGKKQDCDRCREEVLGIEECFRLIAKKGKPARDAGGS